jgi:predicted dehydrogenase
VNFENATADYDLARGSEALRLFERDQPVRTVQCPGGDGYQAELGYFLGCVRNQTPPSVVTANDGLGAVEICEAEEESVRTGAFVQL